MKTEHGRHSDTDKDGVEYRYIESPCPRCGMCQECRRELRDQAYSATKIGEGLENAVWWSGMRAGFLVGSAASVAAVSVIMVLSGCATS